MFFVSNLQSSSQAGRRGFESVSRSMFSIGYKYAVLVNTI